MTTITAISCLIICLRLLFYKKSPTSAHRPIAALIAYLIIIEYGITAIKVIVFGYQTPLLTALISAVFAAIIMYHKGNVVTLFNCPPLMNNILYRLIHDVWDSDGFHWPILKAIGLEIITGIKRLFTSERPNVTTGNYPSPNKTGEHHEIR